MIWLGLSILFSSILYVIFKLFTRFKIHTLQAIVVNYAIAACTGIYMSTTPVRLNTIVEAAWLPWALFMGILFISVFNIMALTAQRNGISVAAVAGKMSLVIPVTIGILVYHESAGWLKIVGICIALLAVYFTTMRSRNAVSKPFELKNLTFPAALFLGSGIIDSVLKHIEVRFMRPDLEATISVTIFSTAFIMGIAILIVDYYKNNRRFEFKSILAGVVLGVPNYFSILFIFKALATNDEASFVYPVNHVGTILVSTLLGLLLFKERLQLRNWVGILLAVVAICFIAFAKA